MERYDLIVLGGGPGGYVAAALAGCRGKKTLLIEQARVGGTCLNRGCIPTKALLHAAETYHNAKTSARLGVDTAGISYDYDRMARYKDKSVNRLRGGVEALLRDAGVVVLTAWGVLAGGGRVEAGGRVYCADNIILAMGAVPATPSIPGADLPGVLNSDKALALKKAPMSMVIVGGGVIGMEFASLFSMLEIPVIVLEYMPRILSGYEEEIVAPVEKRLRRAGVTICTGVKVEGVSKDGDFLSVAFSGSECAGKAEGEFVIFATGRRPATGGLGLENAGVVVDAKGYIRTDERMAAGVPGIWAVGDITGHQQLAHVASAQAAVAVSNICGNSSRMNYNAVPACVYTHPEIAAVGLTEAQALQLGYKVRAGRFPVAANGRGVIMGETEGLAKLIFDERSGEILGAHLCASRAADMISEVSVAIMAEATVEELAAAIHPHPSMSEIIMEAAHDAFGHSVHKPLKKH